MELQNTNTDKLSGDNMEEKIAIKQEYDRKEKETASFIAVLTEKAVYFDEEKDKYILASKKQINELVKEAYKNQDFIRANELLESAKNTLGKDIKKELREIASKSMRLSAKHYFMLVGQAYQKDMSLADVVRYKICDYLKENLKELEINKEKKELLKQSLELWEYKKSIKPKEFYTEEFSLFVDKKYEKAYPIYTKHFFIEELKKDDLSKEQIDLIIRYYDDTWINEEGLLSIEKNGKNQTELNLGMEIYSQEWLKDVDILKNEFSKKYDEIVFDKLVKKYNIDTTKEGMGFELFKQIIEFNITFYPIVKINGFEFENDREYTYLNDKNQKLLKKYVFDKICNIKEKYIESIKKDIEKSMNKNNFEEAQELSNKLAYYDSCKVITDKMLGILSNYISASKVITFTIPKSLLLWFNASGGDKKLSELIEK